MRPLWPAPLLLLACLAWGCAAANPPSDTQKAQAPAPSTMNHADAPLEHFSSSDIPAPGQVGRLESRGEAPRQRVLVPPQAEPAPATPRRAAFKVAYKCQPTPPQAKQPSDWTLKVASSDGHPLDGAQVRISATCLKGGGAAVPPQEARELGRGLYLAKGLVLSRNGLWLVKVEVSSQGTRDSSEVKLLLK